MIFGAQPLFRLTGPGHIPFGDERNIAGYLGIDPILAFLVVLIIVSPPLVTCYRAIRNSRRLLWFLGFFFIGPVIFFLSLFVIDSYILSPLVRVFTSASWMGIQVSMIILAIVGGILFFGKYIKVFVLWKDN